MEEKMFRMILTVFMMLFLLFLISWGRSVFAMEDENKEPIFIVELKKPMEKEEIEALIAGKKGLKLRYIFKYIFPGFSVQGKERELQEFSSIGIVEAIHPSYTYTLQVQKSALLDKTFKGDSIAWIGTEKIRYLTDPKGKRLTGKGVKVGIIDTGIDYTHPDLRKNYKKGYDFVDQDDDPMETVGQGGYDTFHGTHVAGIIGAKGIMTGVAPDVDIYAYRALGPGGRGTTEQIIAAIDRAIEDQVDILNLSLGVSINGPDLPASKALDQAVKKGIIAVTSSGNSGPDIWTVGSPGTSGKAISVGASTPLISIPYLEYKGEKFQLLPLASSKKWRNGESFFLSDGIEGKKEEIKNSHGKLVIIKRGDITFTEKVENAVLAGAKAVIIYNNSEGEFLVELEKDFDIPIALLKKNDGERLLKLLNPKVPAKIHLEKEADRLADFSSRGPVTHTWDIKPDLVAPGVAIISTVPGGYLALQGTSMASPHVTGASALLKQAHPEWTPEQIKAVLMNTSKRLKGKKREYYPYEQGAGRIQLDKALATNSIIRPASLLFGQTDGEAFLETEKTIIVENVGSKPLRYTFRQAKRSELINWHFPPPFYLNPGETRKVPIKMEVKKDHEENKIFHGYIELEAGNENIALPYLYVTKEPDYPRIMSFVMLESDQPGWYRYEVYLPRGADEFGIALFDPDTKRFITFLDVEKNMRRGQVSKEIKINKEFPEGVYVAVAFVKKENREDYKEQLIHISSGHQSQ